MSVTPLIWMVCHGIERRSIDGSVLHPLSYAIDPTDLEGFQRWQAAASENPEILETAIQSIVDKRAEEARAAVETVLREDMPLLLAARSSEHIADVMDVIQARIRQVEHRLRREKAAAESVEQLWKAVRGVRDRLLNVAKTIFFRPKN